MAPTLAPASIGGVQHVPCGVGNIPSIPASREISGDPSIYVSPHSSGPASDIAEGESWEAYLERVNHAVVDETNALWQVAQPDMIVQARSVDEVQLEQRSGVVSEVSDVEKRKTKPKGTSNSNSTSAAGRVAIGSLGIWVAAGWMFASTQ